MKMTGLSPWHENFLNVESFPFLVAAPPPHQNPHQFKSRPSQHGNRAVFSASVVRRSLGSGRASRIRRGDGVAVGKLAVGLGEDTQDWRPGIAELRGGRAKREILKLTL
jgi:hypothetical protein